MSKSLCIRKILLADDDADDRWLFSNFTKERLDLELLNSVTNGVELINYLNAVLEETELPNLIILDQNMPKLNGRETLTALKRDQKYGEIDVVVYSTYMDKMWITECETLGALCVCIKPVSAEGYNQMIDQIIAAIQSKTISD